MKKKKAMPKKKGDEMMDMENAPAEAAKKKGLPFGGGKKMAGPKAKMEMAKKKVAKKKK